MKLLVVIPTWNRADYLDKAIRAIAAARAMARTCTVELFISDNCSSDHTQEVVARWQQNSPWIHYRRWEDHISAPWSGVYKRALQGSGLDYDYIWLQGDDDYICDPAAFEKLAVALLATADNPPAIVHCCQARRSLAGDQRIIAGNTEDLCNTYGWHDLLGWISSLVISKETVRRVLDSPHGNIRPPSAYWHAEVLFEATYGMNMLILSEGLIDPQDEEQTAESSERWAKAKVAQAYWYIIHGLNSLKDRGIITKPLSLRFFRYLTYSFWDRFAVEVITMASSAGVSLEAIELRLGMLRYLGNLLGHGEERKLYSQWLEGLEEEVNELLRLHQRAQKRIEAYEQSSYPFSLLPPLELGRPTDEASKAP